MTVATAEPRILKSIEDVQELQQGDLFVLAERITRPEVYVGRRGEDIVGIQWLPDGRIMETQFFVRDGKYKGLTAIPINSPGSAGDRSELARLEEVGQFLEYKCLLESAGQSHP